MALLSIRTPRLFSVVIAVLCSASVASSADTSIGEVSPAVPDNPNVWEPKTESVAVFKNGLGFFTRRASVELRDGWCHAAEIPPAAFGTLGVYSRDEGQVVDIVGAGPGTVVEFDGYDGPEELEAKRQRLESATGMTVRLDYRHRSTDRQAKGRLVSVEDRYAVVEDAEKTIAVPIDPIRRLQLPELPLRVHVSGEGEESAERAELGMAYLRGGIMWIPEYTLTLIDDETAELTLRGTLVNEAEDLVNCDVHFVVGVPHFVHSDLMSPIAVGRTIRSLGSVMPYSGVPPQVMTQMMNRAAIANNAHVSDAFADRNAGDAGNENPLGDLLGSLPRVESSSSGDFAVYTTSGLTVRKGERAMVTLLTQRIRFGHRYRWDTSGDVRHLLTLQNDGDTPWTTGPCLAVSGVRPLSEDILKYTPASGQGELQVTTAINLAKEVTESERDRQMKAHEPSRSQFLDLVTVAGSIRLKSFEQEKVDVFVTAPVPGRPIEASDDGQIRSDATKLRLQEREGSIEWRVSLDPGEEVTLGYAYERYVPSN